MCQGIGLREGSARFIAESNALNYIKLLESYMSDRQEMINPEALRALRYSDQQIMRLEEKYPDSPDIVKYWNRANEVESYFSSKGIDLSVRDPLTDLALKDPFKEMAFPFGKLFFID